MSLRSVLRSLKSRYPPGYLELQPQDRCVEPGTVTSESVRLVGLVTDVEPETLVRTGCSHIRSSRPTIVGSLLGVNDT